MGHRGLAHRRSRCREEGTAVKPACVDAFSRIGKADAEKKEQL
jgi:hypothetical protein